MMAPDVFMNAVTGMLGLIIVPWCVWVTVTLFNQRQEIALLKQILYTLKDLRSHQMHE